MGARQVSIPMFSRREETEHVEIPTGCSHQQQCQTEGPLHHVYNGSANGSSISNINRKRQSVHLAMAKAMSKLVGHCSLRFDPSNYSYQYCRPDFRSSAFVLSLPLQQSHKMVITRTPEPQKRRASGQSPLSLILSTVLRRNLEHLSYPSPDRATNLSEATPSQCGRTS